MLSASVPITALTPSVAIDALNAGVHVLLEKPMCVTLEEAVAICRAEKKNGKVLSIGFQPQF